MSWSIQNLWNETLLTREETKPRDYIRASEIGYSFRDRYYKMLGEQPTNPFSARILRVFEAGKMYEWLVRLVLIRCGLLQQEQTEVRIEGNHLPVVGHLDFIGGGKPNWDEAKKIAPALEYLQFPFNTDTIAQEVIKQLQEQYPDGLPELLYDIKSVNSMVFWKHNKDKGMTEAFHHHVMQMYTYMKGMRIPEARVLYISKDDLTLAEIVISPDAQMENEWMTDVVTMSNYYRNRNLPPLDPIIVWEKTKYQTNWLVIRSNYWSKMYDLPPERMEDWVNTMDKLVSRANYRVKKAWKLHPELTPWQVQQLINPYIESELLQIKTGKVQIEKEGVYDVEEGLE